MNNSMYTHPRPQDIYKHVINKCDYTLNNLICGRKPVVYYIDQFKSVISRCEHHWTPNGNYGATLISFGEHAYEEALVWEILES
jgi:hypothetical protein